MEMTSSDEAVKAFFALAQANRLAVFRLLVQNGPAGLAAGKIAAGVGIPASTLSAHLTILANSGLIVARRESRSIRYSVAFDGIRPLLAFLLEDCCGGQPEICATLIDGLLPACAVTAAQTG
jgi:DNA-binding transcriptional ArsR family regulator